MMTTTSTSSSDNQVSQVNQVGVLAKAISQEFEGQSIRIDVAKQMICASDMCKVNKKKPWSKYIRMGGTKELISELEGSLRIRRDLLITTRSKGLNHERGTWVHIKIALDLARWISPKFALFMYDVFARFMTGDLTLAKNVVECANSATGKVNNVQVATNPKNGKVIAITEQFDKDDMVAMAKYKKVKQQYRAMKRMCEEKGMTIIHQEDKIDKLTATVNRLEALMNAMDVKLDETKSTLTRTEAKLDRTEVKLDETFIQLGEANTKLDRVLDDRVDVDSLPPGKREQLVFLVAKEHDPNAYNMYAIRRQKSAVNQTIRKIKNEYPEYEFRTLASIDHPNSRALWNNFKREFADAGFDFDTDTNMFDLPEGMSIDRFVQMIDYMNERRRDVD